MPVLIDHDFIEAETLVGGFVIQGKAGLDIGQCAVVAAVRHVAEGKSVVGCCRAVFIADMLLEHGTRIRGVVHGKINLPQKQNGAGIFPVFLNRLDQVVLGFAVILQIIIDEPLIVVIRCRLVCQIQSLLQIIRPVRILAAAVINFVDIDEKVVVRAEGGCFVEICLCRGLVPCLHEKPSAQEKDFRIRFLLQQAAVDLHCLVRLTVPCPAVSQIEIDVFREFGALVLYVQQALFKGDAGIRVIGLTHIGKTLAPVSLRQEFTGLHGTRKRSPGGFIIPGLQLLHAFFIIALCFGLCTAGK